MSALEGPPPPTLEERDREGRPAELGLIKLGIAEETAIEELVNDGDRWPEWAACRRELLIDEMDVVGVETL